MKSRAHPRAATKLFRAMNDARLGAPHGRTRVSRDGTPVEIEVTDECECGRWKGS